jgi:hypothetical protein
MSWTKDSMQTQINLNCMLMAMVLLMTTTIAGPVQAENKAETKFKRIPIQFIAALGDPTASSGTGAQSWGIWRKDPGPRGVRLEKYSHLQAANGVAPAQWKFDNADWWLEEHGLIMEQPEFPLPAGKYLVTGDREVTAALTIHPTDNNGSRRWELANGATLYDVTHLPCRSARYIPATDGGSCSPAKALRSAFPVTPGAAMPEVAGCAKQDYAVLFVIGVAVEGGR